MKINSIEQLKGFLGIKHSLYVCEDDDLNERLDCPYWVYFYIFIGWYLRKHNSSKQNCVCFLSSPNRTYVSSLVALGAQIAGSQIFVEQIDWDYLKNLEPGTEVFIYDKKNKKKGKSLCIVEDKYEIEGSIFVPFRFKDDKNKTTRAISVEYIDQYTITNVPLSSKTRIALNKNGKFFENLLEKFDYRWMVTSSIDSVIASDAETLKRETSNIYLSHQNSDSAIKLSNLVGLEDEAGVSHSKTGIIKPRSSQMQEIKSPICILNGPIALKHYAECKAITEASTLVFVADHGESTEDYQRLLSMWGKGAQFGLNSQQEYLIEIPSSVECAIFSVA